MKEKISVIIPTVNAYEELDLALTSLAKNSDFEIDYVIVVDPDLSAGKVNKKIIEVCQSHGVKPTVNKKNLGPYGSWNRGAEVATTNWLVFATDDQYFAPHWDSNLLKYWAPKRLVAGRLVEPGVIPPYKTNILQNFGDSPSAFKEQEFIAWVAGRHDTGYAPDGFFIPILQKRADFDALGHYPVAGKFGTSTAVSNDYLYIQDALKKGYQFGTASDSYSYHFQASSWKKKNLSPTIAAVILTHNEEQDLSKCLKSLTWTSDIFVIDSGSTDQTLSIAKKSGAKVINHAFTNFSAQRNFALTKVVSYDWVLMIDADEVVEGELAKELQFFAKDIYLEGVNIPRKNYIFGKWIEHTDWYPDYHLSFFRPKLIQYQGEVHELAGFIKGNGTVATASHHLIHHNYDSVAEFIEKNYINYPQKYAKDLVSKGYKLSYQDIVQKPFVEFMQRFFSAKGYKDGIYGLTLSLLMAGSVFAEYLYVWELEGKPDNLTNEETSAIFSHLMGKGSELSYWLATLTIESATGATKLLHRARRKALKLIKGL